MKAIHPRRTLATFAALLAGLLSVHAQMLLADSTAEAALPGAPSFVMQQTASEAAPSGVIQGEVTDIHGGVVPGATIKLLSKTPNILERETTTDSNGLFAFAAAPSTYTVLIQAKGLETFLSEPFTLHANEKFEVPDVALPIATADTTIEVSANSAQVAEQELKIETRQRVLGVFPNFYTSFIYNAAPLNTRQKFKLTLRSTMDPIAFLNVGIVAAIEQAHGTFKDFGPGPAGYGRRYGAAQATSSSDALSAPRSFRPSSTRIRATSSKVPPTPSAGGSSTRSAKGSLSAEITAIFKRTTPGS